MRYLGVLCVFVIGCGSDTAAMDDLAMPDDLAVTGCQPPAVVANPYVLTVRVHHELSAKYVGATVEMRSRSDDSLLASGVTDGNGAAILSTPSGGMAVDAYLVARPAGGDAGVEVSSEEEFQDGLFLPFVDITLYPAATHHAAATSSGADWNEANQITDVWVARCNTTGTSNGLAGATISVVPGQGTRYQSGGNGFDSTLTSTANVGVGTDFNVPDGPVHINVGYMGAMLSFATRAQGGTYHRYHVYP